MHKKTLTQKSKVLFLGIVIFTCLFSTKLAKAQEIHTDLQGTWRAVVTRVISTEDRMVEGTETKTKVQFIEAEILEGERKGETVTFENDYIELEEKDHFFLDYLITIDGNELYSVRDINRGTPLLVLCAIFIAAVLIFSGKQGVRSLLSLAGSLLIILYLLVPALLHGYPPVLTSIGIATCILFVAIFFTHGFNRESVAAFLGTVSAILCTGLFAYLSLIFTHLTGFNSDEAVYLNFQTRGALNFAGMLLGAIIIGVLGVLDDIAITQSAIVSELYASGHTNKKEIYKRAMRIGREHVGALVNTLALAYTGASLPLLLLFSTSESSVALTLNSEIFATEIVRTVIGSIGLILTVPITTVLAVILLDGHSQKHGHIHTHSV